jgi:hypothetical protein
LKLNGPLSSCLAPLTHELPSISCIQYAFIHQPQSGLKFTGLTQLAESPLLTNAVRDAIDASLLCVVIPNRMRYKMQSNNNNYIDTNRPPVGICLVTALQCRGFIMEKKWIRPRIIREHLDITFAANPNIWRTHDNHDLEWNEWRGFVLHDLSQKLQLHA